MSVITPQITILLSTYNGAPYLRQQLDSIRNQTRTDWILLIRDDGSTDNTLAIINEFSNIDARIMLVKDTLGNQKPCRSFSILLEYYLKHSTTPYVFFCDQDDVWHCDKLSLQTAALATEIPTLTFSDLIVVDSDLKTIHSSFFAYENYQAITDNALLTLLVHNYIPGCTIGMNRALAEKAWPIPETAIMHDWWCALNAAAFGQLIFSKMPTVYYRQHRDNTIGAHGYYFKMKLAFTQLHAFKKSYLQKRNHFLPRFAQAHALQERINGKNHSIISEFCLLPKKKFVNKLKSALKLKPTGFMRKLYFIYFLLLF